MHVLFSTCFIVSQVFSYSQRHRNAGSSSSERPSAPRSTNAPPSEYVPRAKEGVIEIIDSYCSDVYGGGNDSESNMECLGSSGIALPRLPTFSFPNPQHHQRTIGGGIHPSESDLGFTSFNPYKVENLDSDDVGARDDYQLKAMSQVFCRKKGS